MESNLISGLHDTETVYSKYCVEEEVQKRKKMTHLKCQRREVRSQDVVPGQADPRVHAFKSYPTDAFLYSRFPFPNIWQFMP